ASARAGRSRLRRPRSPERAPSREDSRSTHPPRSPGRTNRASISDSARRRRMGMSKTAGRQAGSDAAAFDSFAGERAALKAKGFASEATNAQLVLGFLRKLAAEAITGK